MFPLQPCLWHLDCPLAECPTSPQLIGAVTGKGHIYTLPVPGKALRNAPVGTLRLLSKKATSNKQGSLSQPSYPYGGPEDACCFSQIKCAGLLVLENEEMPSILIEMIVTCGHEKDHWVTLLISKFTVQRNQRNSLP